MQRQVKIGWSDAAILIVGCSIGIGVAMLKDSGHLGAVIVAVFAVIGLIGLARRVFGWVAGQYSSGTPSVEAPKEPTA